MNILYVVFSMLEHADPVIRARGIDILGKAIPERFREELEADRNDCVVRALLKSGYPSVDYLLQAVKEGHKGAMDALMRVDLTMSDEATVADFIDRLYKDCGSNSMEFYSLLRLIMPGIGVLNFEPENEFEVFIKCVKLEADPNDYDHIDIVYEFKLRWLDSKDFTQEMRELVRSKDIRKLRLLSNELRKRKKEVDSNLGTILELIMDEDMCQSVRRGLLSLVDADILEYTLSKENVEFKPDWFRKIVASRSEKHASRLLDDSCEDVRLAAARTCWAELSHDTLHRGLHSESEVTSRTFARIVEDRFNLELNK